MARVLNIHKNDIYFQYHRPEIRENFEKIESLEYKRQEWSVFFHGDCQCDLENLEDRTHVRYEFNPLGRFDNFTGWGVLNFIMTYNCSRKNYSSLQNYLARTKPPYNYLAGDYEKMLKIYNLLKENKHFQELESQRTSIVVLVS